MFPLQGTRKFPCTFQRNLWQGTWIFPCTLLSVLLQGTRKFPCTLQRNLWQGTRKFPCTFPRKLWQGCGKVHGNFHVPCQMSRKRKKGQITSITDKVANRFQNLLNLQYSSCFMPRESCLLHPFYQKRTFNLRLLFTMFVAFPAENYSFKLILATRSWQKS